jgi:diacylglycerol kinase (ATP)
MRVLLMHNPTAGEGDPSAAELMAILRSAGYEAVYQSTKEEGFAEPLARPWDLVIAAGGDGAVVDVARGLPGPEIPFTVLPLGTANNFAASMGIEGDLEGILAGLRRPVERIIRPAVARGEWGERTIWEGVGVGLFPRLIRATEALKDTGIPSSGREMLLQPLLLWATELADARPIGVRGAVDTRPFAGDFLIAEVPIVPLLGPQLPLAPAADPCDERLDMVLIGEGERWLLLDYLNERINGRQDADPPALPALSGAALALEWSGSPLRLDDELWPATDSADAAGRVEIVVGATARTVWIPGRAADPAAR